MLRDGHTIVGVVYAPNDGQAWSKFAHLCIENSFRRNRQKYAEVENTTLTPDKEIPLVQHWAYRNDEEYFAELSEAYFFRGTSYPWNRVALFKSDPDGFNMVRGAWNDPGFCASGPQQQTPEPLYAPVIEHWNDVR